MWSSPKCSHSFVNLCWTFSRIFQSVVDSPLADAVIADPCDGSIFDTITCASYRLCSANRHGFSCVSVSSHVLLEITANRNWIRHVIWNDFFFGAEFVPLANFSALYARIALPRLSWINLSKRTKIPCFGLHVKYWMSCTVPSFLPVGVSNSIPIHVPPCKSIQFFRN